MTRSRAMLGSIGLAAWVVGAVLPSTGLWHALLLAPLVIVPTLICRADTPWPHPDVVALVAALPLVPASALAPGVGAALLAVPWLCVSAAIGIVALRDGLRSLPGILAPSRVSDLGQLVARGFLAVGGFFVLAERGGLTLGFDSQIVMLTAVHFHFAGFGLLTIASLLARRTPKVSLAVNGLVGGIPLTALGFVTGLPWVNASELP
jgi:hypothetical protein